MCSTAKQILSMHYVYVYAEKSGPWGARILEENIPALFAIQSVVWLPAPWTYMVYVHYFMFTLWKKVNSFLGYWLYPHFGK